MKILGIDPGLNGGFAVIDTTIDPFLYSMQIMPVRKDGAVDGKFIFDWVLAQKVDSAFFEDVHSIYGIGAKQNFNLGINIGIIKGSLNCAGVEYKLVQPKEWQASCHQGVYSKEVRAKDKTLDAATRLYPDLVKRLTPQKTARMKYDPKPHDGLIDALMIAHYGKIIREVKPSLNVL